MQVEIPYASSRGTGNNPHTCEGDMLRGETPLHVGGGGSAHLGIFASLGKDLTGRAKEVPTSGGAASLGAPAARTQRTLGTARAARQSLRTANALAAQVGAAAETAEKTTRQAPRTGVRPHQTQLTPST